MRYQSRSATSYMFRNFGKLFYVALPVAVLMAFFVNPSQEAIFSARLITGEFASFDEMFGAFTRAMTVWRFGRFWWVSLLSLLLLALTESLLIVKINRHMHVGEMHALPFKMAFRLFPVTLLVIVCVFVASEIVLLLSVGVTYLLRSINSVTAVAAVGTALSFVLRLLCTWIFMLLLIALPLKYSENYPLNIAFAYSVRVMTKQNRVVWCSTLFYVLGRYVVMVCAHFAAPYKLDILIYAVMYLFVVLILPCLAYRLYHDAVGGERRDISQIMFE